MTIDAGTLPKSRPTKEEWELMRASLSYPFGRVVLRVDGYEVALEVRSMKALRYTIAVFVNGWMRGEWLGKDCEERRRFFRPRKSNFWSKRRLNELRKAVGKRIAEREQKKGEFTWYCCDWPTFGPLKKHLLANNQSIELLEPKCPP